MFSTDICGNKINPQVSAEDQDTTDQYYNCDHHKFEHDHGVAEIAAFPLRRDKPNK